jgi:plastocyanin
MPVAGRQAWRRALALVVGVVLLACGSDGSGPTDPDDDALEVHLTSDATFAPANLTVAPGTKVRWINDSNTYHTITPQNPGQPGVWAEVETASPGPVFEFTFNVPGQTYPYRSLPYSSDFSTGMVGRIVVTAGGS